MPPRSDPPAPALDTAPGGAAAVDRALALLLAFAAGDSALALAELARRTGLHKSTALRLLASLAHAGLVERLPDARWRLGAELARLAAVRAGSSTLDASVRVALEALVAATGESASFHVIHGAQRLCLVRVDSPHVLRDHIRAGDLLPLDRGAGGRVLRAFSGARGTIAARIRRDGVVVLEGDRVEGLAGVSSPVFGAGGALVGAITLTMPAARLRRSHAPAVKAAAAELSRRLGGAPAVASSH